MSVMFDLTNFESTRSFTTVSLCASTTLTSDSASPRQPSPALHAPLHAVLPSRSGLAVPRCLFFDFFFFFNSTCLYPATRKGYAAAGLSLSNREKYSSVHSGQACRRRHSSTAITIVRESGPLTETERTEKQKKRNSKLLCTPLGHLRPVHYFLGAVRGFSVLIL